MHDDQLETWMWPKTSKQQGYGGLRLASTNAKASMHDSGLQEIAERRRGSGLSSPKTSSIPTSQVYCRPRLYLGLKARQAQCCKPQKVLMPRHGNLDPENCERALCFGICLSAVSDSSCNSKELFRLASRNVGSKLEPRLGPKDPIKRTLDGTLI